MNNTETVRRHLMTTGHISPAEAMTVYKMVRLAPRIKELRDELPSGMLIETTHKQDGRGDQYTSYVYTGPGLAGTPFEFEKGVRIVDV